MASNDKKITKLLETSHKGRGEATGVLARLWRELLGVCNITPQMWTQLVTNYLNDPHNRIPREGKKRSSERNNLNKELSRPNISWNVLYKGIKVLAPIQLKIDITLSFPGGKTKSVSLVKNVKALSAVTGEDSNDAR